MGGLPPEANVKQNRQKLFKKILFYSLTFPEIVLYFTYDS